MPARIEPRTSRSAEGAQVALRLVQAALRRCVGAVLLAICACAWAAGPVQIETLYFRGKTPEGQPVAAKQIAMPRVRMADAAIAAKINDRLFIDILSGLAPRRPEKHFTAADGVDISGTADQRFSVARNDERVLSLDFDAEGCGAYCERYARSYAFDLTSGRFLSGDELFTREGMRELARRMTTERVKRHRLEIARWNRELRVLQKRGEKWAGQLSDTDDRVALNEHCLETIEADRASEGTTPVHSRFDLLRYRVAVKTFEITAERCSNHASRALDDVGEVTLRFAYPQLRGYMTPYARALLLNEPPAAPSGSVYGQVLRGHLGRDIPITMLLRKYGGASVGGVYFYDRVGKPIGLTGEAKGDVLELTERHESGEPRARLVLTLKPNRLEGSWSGAREYTVELTP